MGKSRLPQTLRRARERSGFTLLELVTVIAVLALLVLTLVPAVAGSRTKSQSARCLSNLRQIMGAMLMYTHDNHDFFPANPGDGNTVPGHNWCQGEAGVGEFQQFDPDPLANPATCLITTYVNTNVSLFRCTADARMGLYQGTNAALIGTIVPAARTISMNGGVGTICATYNSLCSGHSGAPNLPVNGPWLTGKEGGCSGNRHNSPWRTYGKLSEMVIPIPARLFVMTEENPWSINDATLVVSASIPEWVDWPSTLHEGGCVLTFADGHAELHKWVTGTLDLQGGAFLGDLTATNADWLWLSQRATAWGN
jgi:prepilin-type N-terminal cleavage/methylation domain-containing protein/prepilin-type processing-associated H-X9-DG protein